jgi:hypothetical protein
VLVVYTTHAYYIVSEILLKASRPISAQRHRTGTRTSMPMATMSGKA